MPRFVETLDEGMIPIDRITKVRQSDRSGRLAVRYESRDVLLAPWVRLSHICGTVIPASGAEEALVFDETCDRYVAQPIIGWLVDVSELEMPMPITWAGCEEACIVRDKRTGRVRDYDGETFESLGALEVEVDRRMKSFDAEMDSRAPPAPEVEKKGAAKAAPNGHAGESV